MSQAKRRVADFLFAIQVIGAIAFCVPYAVRSLTDVQGSSLVQFVQVAAYLLFHLSLGISVLRSAPNRVNRQLVATYAIWLVLISGIITAVLSNPLYHWNGRETAILQTAAVLTLAVLAFAAVHRLPVSDPMVKAMFAIGYKSVPQVLLAWKFLAEGASGTPGPSVVIGHATIVIRLAQLGLMVRESGWDRNRFWLIVSESLNELTWLAATTAWLMV